MIQTAAVAALRRGGLVVLPTETVYGLAADAENPHAVARIYAVKGRPADHPLIVHIADAGRLDEWARDVPDYARALARKFWPGPMTLVLHRSDRVGDYVTGGQDTVAIRVPDHDLARAVLAEFDSAVAAPSANRFGHVSPTTAAHVVHDLGYRLDRDLDVVVDGGPCRIGIESTIVDCTGPVPVVLRPGAVSAAQIRTATGLAPAKQGATRVPRVSGSLESHYAPRARVLVLEPGETPGPATRTGNPAIGLLALAPVPTPGGWVRLALPGDADQFANVLYRSLREADDLQLTTVVAVLPPEGSGAAAAVRDRLVRASAAR